MGAAAQGRPIFTTSGGSTSTTSASSTTCSASTSVSTLASCTKARAQARPTSTPSEGSPSSSCTSASCGAAASASSFSFGSRAGAHASRLSTPMASSTTLDNPDPSDNCPARTLSTLGAHDKSSATEVLGVRVTSSAAESGPSLSAIAGLSAKTMSDNHSRATSCNSTSCSWLCELLATRGSTFSIGASSLSCCLASEELRSTSGSPTSVITSLPPSSSKLCLWPNTAFMARKTGSSCEGFAGKL
mmetsp:Transcript_122837/g.393507  ORF Transcript_122837/g.393507 Transcript_122837/m.393507 type:complete len:245 (+) Transcript_122837:619-1353(+)